MSADPFLNVNTRSDLKRLEEQLGKPAPSR